MNKVKSLFINSINLPLYLIAKLIPKYKDIWIFGAWFGEKYGDNSKYFFEYINMNYPDVKSIWLTENKNVYDLIKLKGYRVYYSYSILGYFYTSIASYAFVSTGFDDVNKFVFTQKYINLWHGIPLKKIVKDDNLINSINYDSIFFKLKKFLFPYIRDPQCFDKIIASSNEEAKNLSTAFGKSLDDIWLTGLPRNDVFSIEKRKSIQYKIIYMPTHRNEGELDISGLFMNKLDKINSILKILDIELYIKLHFYHMKNLNFKNFSNVKIILDENIEQDIYSIVNEFDLLITDYSSIYFDYLLTDKPIIFAPFDYDKYITQDRELYYDYDEVTPGPKCQKWEEVLYWIEKFKNDSSLYSDERKKVRERFHKFQDNKSCERVYNKIMGINYE